MISVYVKMLTGELIEIQYTPNGEGFSQFVDLMYKACPDIPFGCLSLHRLCYKGDKDDKDENELGHLVHVYEDDDCIYLSDGDFLGAFVDTSLIYPIVKFEGNNIYVNRKTRCHEVSVRFCETKYRDSRYHYEKINIFYDEVNRLFALISSFTHVSTVTDHSNYNYEDPITYFNAFYFYEETSQTQWHTSIQACLLSSNGNFPRDKHTMDRVETKFNFRRVLDFDYDDDN
jgi:hypothetical protein